MSIEIKAGTVTKRSNSTYVPTTELTDTYAVVLKEGCSDHNPVFLLNISSNTFPHNYLKWGDWYYFIDDVIREHNQLMSIHCHLDELATYKAYILAGSAFVLYDTTGNTELIDNRLSRNTTENININTGDFTKLGSVSSAGRGTVVIGVVTKDGFTYYATDVDTATELLNHVNEVTIPEIITEPNEPSSEPTIDELVTGFYNFGQNVANFFTNVMSNGTAKDCIISCKEIALPSGAFYGNSQTIYLGNYPTTLSGKALTGRRVDVDTVTISIPWTYSDWRRNAPYTQHYFYSAFVGLIPLPEDQIIGCTTIDCYAYYDMISGDVIFELWAISGSTRICIGSYTGNISAEFSLGSVAIPYSKYLAGSVATAVGAGAALVNPAVGAGMALTGINLSNSPIPSSVSGGGGGASLAIESTCRIIEITHNTNVEPTSISSVMGTPSMASKTLSSLTGFCQTRNASIAIPASKTVIDSINSQLDAGIYIE